MAIGMSATSTTGSTVLSNAQPFLEHHGEEYYAIATTDLTHAQAVRRELEARGSIFPSTMATEVSVHLMARHLQDGIESALTHALSRVEGAYSLVMLTRNLVIAARDPRGFRPLCLGRLGDGWARSLRELRLRPVEPVRALTSGPGDRLHR
jgi:amidophosphoribosyltransferase